MNTVGLEHEGRGESRAPYLMPEAYKTGKYFSSS